MSTPFDDRAPKLPATGSGRRSFWREGAAAWGLGQGMIVILCALPIVIALAGAASAMLGKDTYKWITGEDGIVEWSQVVLYFFALTGCLAVMSRASDAGRQVQLLYFCVCLGLVFLLGEELSWGQRLFGWSTPESLAMANKQGETNLHNVQGIGNGFKWVQLVVGAYGLFLPLLFLDAHRKTRAYTLDPWVVPPATLIPYFAPMFVWRVYRNFFEPPQRFHFVVAEYNEVIELLLAMGFALFMWFQVRAIRNDPTAEHIATRVATLSGGAAHA